jgi:predicted dehydrogenase
MSGVWIDCATKLGLELVALVDVNPAAAQRQVQSFGLTAAVYSNLEDAIAKSDADILFDCTVPSAHHEVCSLALRAGLHVLGEKPLALTLVQAAELIDLAQQQSRVHAVMQNRRFNRGIRLLRQEIVAERVGEITEVHVDFFIGPHFGGFREEMRHVLLADMAIHTFDAGRYVIGDNAAAVYCEEWNPTNSWFRHGASGLAIFTMADGRRFSYRGSWCADGFATSWDASWRVVGTGGTLLWDGADTVQAARIRSTGGFLSETEIVHPVEEPDPKLTQGHLSVMKQFIDALQGGPSPETISTDNIHSLAMTTAAIESAETGRKVAVGF